MTKIQRQRAFLVCLFSTTLFLTGCGESTPDAAAPSETQTTSTGESRECEKLSAELVQRVGMEFQLTRNLAMTGGKNLASMEKNMSLPSPDTFRSFATEFEQVDASSVESLPNFDKPAVAANSLREFADKLQAALAQKENLDHPAWAELTEFSKQKQNRLQGSVNYYLSELGCK